MIRGGLMSVKLFEGSPLTIDVACSTLVLPPAAVHVTRMLSPSSAMLIMRNKGNGWVSTTSTSCVQVALLPQESVAIQTTWLVPGGNCATASLITVAAPPQPSEVI